MLTKSIFTLLFLTISSAAFAAIPTNSPVKVASPVTAASPKVASTKLYGSNFCREYACDDTSPYKTAEGETLVQIRLAKDPLNLDLRGTLNGSVFKELTLRFSHDDGHVDRKVVRDLLTTLTGKAPADADLDKVIASATEKTRKDDFDVKEAVKVGSLSIRSGAVLKKPTIQILF